MKLELTFIEAISVYMALLSQKERQRATLRDLLGRGMDPDAEDARTIAGALSTTNAVLDAIDALMYPRPTDSPSVPA